MFPDTVRAAVFDGARDPNADTTEWTVQQLRGYESTLSTFLAQCSANSDCAFHNGGDAEGAFNALMAEPDSLEKLKQNGFDPVVKDVAASNDYYKSQVQDWGKMVNAIGFSN